jgi:hypothetical protein
MGDTKVLRIKVKTKITRYFTHSHFRIKVITLLRATS